MTAKFCTACQCHRPIDGGVFKRGKKFMRWMCNPCSERKTESIYRNKSGKVADVAKLMTKLYEAAEK